MKLDTRQPSFVFLGAWNPAIFQPGWVAHHLFEIAEGNQIKATQVIATDRPERPIFYIGQIGIAASRDRIEIYANTLKPEGAAIAEKVALRLFQTLPHTPFGEFGVNFHFTYEDMDAAIVDMLRVNDHLDESYKIVEASITSKILLPDKNVLNFTRHTSPDSIAFNFNYHYGVIKPTTAEALLHGSLQKNLGHASELLKRAYNLEGYTEVQHALED